MARENGPFEDVFPIEHGDIPWLCSCARGLFSTTTTLQPQKLMICWGVISGAEKTISKLNYEVHVLYNPCMIYYIYIIYLKSTKCIEKYSMDAAGLAEKSTVFPPRIVT